MPLEQVADDIRTTLARPIARQNMDEALNAVRSAMRTYYGKYIAWEVAQDQTTEKTEPPATPDLRAIASQYGLKYGQTPLVDVLQLQETDLVTGEPLYQISRAYDMNFVSFAQQAFSDTLNVFEARSIRGQAVDSEYVYWKTAEEKEFVPELDQVRDEVVRTIKMRQPNCVNPPSDLPKPTAMTRTEKFWSPTRSPGWSAPDCPIFHLKSIKFPGSDFLVTAS
jgi:hypothetical protein